MVLVTLIFLYFEYTKCYENTKSRIKEEGEKKKNYTYLFVMHVRPLFSINYSNKTITNLSSLMT